MTREQAKELRALLDEFGWGWLAMYNFVCPASQSRQANAVRAIVAFCDRLQQPAQESAVPDPMSCPHCDGVTPRGVLEHAPVCPALTRADDANDG